MGLSSKLAKEVFILILQYSTHTSSQIDTRLISDPELVVIEFQPYSIFRGQTAPNPKNTATS